MTNQRLKEAIQELSKYARTNLDPSFKIYKADLPVIEKLIVWSIMDQDRAKDLGIDLNKGILLVGPVGCGKTTLMKAVKCLLHENRSFAIKAATEMAFTFAKEGYGAIQKFSFDSIANKGTSRRRVLHYCFDDLGHEPKEIMYYGNNCNVFAYLLNARFELFQSSGMLTHATTNLNVIKLKQRYGDRLASRLRVMFNLVPFPKGTADKRLKL